MVLHSQEYLQVPSRIGSVYVRRKTSVLGTSPMESCQVSEFLNFHRIRVRLCVLFSWCFVLPFIYFNLIYEYYQTFSYHLSFILYSHPHQFSIVVLQSNPPTGTSLNRYVRGKAKEKDQQQHFKLLPLVLMPLISRHFCLCLFYPWHQNYRLHMRNRFSPL